MKPDRSRHFGRAVVLSLLALACSDGPREPQLAAAAASAEAKFVYVNGVMLQYLDWGGTGGGLVFITASATRLTFDDIAPAFRDRFRVIAYARRGHGRSERKGPYDHATLVEDLRQLLDSLGIDRAVLAGWSLGGNELSEFAVLHPERVAGLVYLESYDITDPGLANAFVSSPVNFSAGASDLASAAAFRTWWKRVNAPNTPFTPAMESQITDLIDVAPDGSVSIVTNDSIATALRQGAAYHPQWAAITAPILAIWGRWYREGVIPSTEPDSLLRKVDRYLQSEVHPWQDAAIARFRATAPGARIVVLENTGHNEIVFQRRDTIVAEMRRLLAMIR